MGQEEDRRSGRSKKNKTNKQKNLTANDQRLKVKERHTMESVMDWSPQSSDCDIIDIVWDHLRRKHNKRAKVQGRGLENYSSRRLKQESLPKRVQDVLKNKGGQTKY